MRILFLSFLFTVLYSMPDALAQSQVNNHETIIRLYNPSFEDMPRNSRAPRGWLNCGFMGESPPDTQPDSTFKVFQPANNGNTYLGMVTRDNDTWEAVAQRLNRPLEAGKCYSFGIFLARSESYLSVSQTTGANVNYDTPSVLRIWGGAGRCDKRELLHETSTITHTRWLEYKFKFTPAQTHTYIVLEATYKMPTLFPTNGNLLIDNASPIVMIPCSQDVNDESFVTRPEETTPAIAEARINTKPQNPQPKPNTPDPVTKPPTKTTTPPKPSTPKPKVAKPKILAELDRNKIKEGQIIQISKLYFEADTFALQDNSFEVLDEIYEFLRENPKVAVEIGGHTNGIPEPEFCDWLSEKRAQEVAKYLVSKGIRNSRLEYKGYGKRKPIATNKTASGRKRNQRVEIKILSVNG